MKAIVYREFGMPDVLHLEDVEKPVPRDDEVLIKVHAASINSWDWDLLRGVPALLRMAKPRHPVLGCDIAGIVDAAGRDVTDLKPGDQIFGDISGCGWGGFAEYVCARSAVMAIKPPNLSFEAAAALPQAGVLALQGLRRGGKFQEGKQILINGGGGGVGTLAIQMAKNQGALVTGVDRTDKLDLMRSLGADHVIDYTRDDFTRNGQQYDLIVDVTAQHSLLDYKRSMVAGGRCVLIGGTAGVMLQAVLAGSWAFGSRKIVLLLHKPNRADLERLGRLTEDGTIHPVIDNRYPLTGTADAFRYFGGGNARGKVVIKVGNY